MASYITESDKHALIDKISEEEIYKKLYRANQEKENDHNWEVYKVSGDRDYHDAIVTNITIPAERKFIIFHGACHGCMLQKENIKNCLSCTWCPNIYDIIQKPLYKKQKG